MTRSIPSMPLPGAVAIALFAVLSGCGFSERLNTPPESLEPEGGYPDVVQDPRPLVARITAIKTARTPGGIILRAFADPGAAGYWDPDLVDVTPDDPTGDVITLEFRAMPPAAGAGIAAGSDGTLDAATFLSDAETRGMRRIEVVGASGSRSFSP